MERRDAARRGEIHFGGNHRAVAVDINRVRHAHQVSRVIGPQRFEAIVDASGDLGEGRRSVDAANQRYSNVLGRHAHGHLDAVSGNARVGDVNPGRERIADRSFPLRRNRQGCECIIGFSDAEAPRAAAGIDNSNRSSREIRFDRDDHSLLNVDVRPECRSSSGHGQRMLGGGNQIERHIIAAMFLFFRGPSEIHYAVVGNARHAQRA